MDMSLFTPEIPASKVQHILQKCLTKDKEETGAEKISEDLILKIKIIGSST